MNMTFVSYFERFETERIQRPNCKCYGIDMFGFYLYEISKLTRFTDFHPIHKTKGFFFIILLCNICFRDEREFISNQNTKMNYILECYNQDILLDVQTTQKYLLKYAQRNLIGIGKQAQLLDRLLHDYLFFNPLFISNRENSLIEPYMHALYQGKPHKHHVFDIHIFDITLTNEQQYVLNNILHNPIGLHILIGTPRSGKTFFVKYMAQHFRLSQNNVFMCATTGTVTLRLSLTASAAHTLFRISSWGYLSPLQEPSIVLEKLQISDVIVIDETSMMTSYMLCTVEHRLKLAARNTLPNALRNKLILLVRDFAQLPAICIHSPKSLDILCRGCHITFAPCWATAKHHLLRMSL